MNTASQIKTLVAVAVLSVASTQSAQAVGHIDDLAYRLERQSRALISEIRSHYRHTGQYHHMLSDAYQVNRLARHIHTMAHHQGNLFHIRNDVERLDRLFHHLEELIEHTDVHPHGGHIHGHTGHVFGFIQSMENTLHHLREDLDRLTRPRCQFDRHDVHDIHSHNTIRFGNGRVSFRFGF